MNRPRRRRPAGKRRGDEQAPETSGVASKARRNGEPVGALQAAGPAIRLRARDAGSASRESESAPALTLRGTESTRHEVEVHGNGTTLRLRGKTTADFDGGSSQIVNRQVQRATGCENCGDDECLRVTGTLVLTYRVTTTVTLPSVNDYPDLTPCQRRRVQDAIDNVLAPHEQEHVRAFETYNGTSRHPFHFKVCSSEEANERLQAIHDSDANTRQASAQALSDALDPFHFDVDLDCEDEEPPEQQEGPATGEGATPEAEAPSPETLEQEATEAGEGAAPEAESPLPEALEQERSELAPEEAEEPEAGEEGAELEEQPTAEAGLK